MKWNTHRIVKNEEHMRNIRLRTWIRKAYIHLLEREVSVHSIYSSKHPAYKSTVLETPLVSFRHSFLLPNIMI